MFGHFTRRGPKRDNARLRLESLESRDAPALLNVPAIVANNVVDRPESATIPGKRVVVWTQRNGGFDTDIWAQRFTQAGDKVGAPIRVTSSADPENEPDVCMDAAGNFDVSYTRNGVTGSHIEIARFNAAGGFIERLFVPSLNTFFNEKDSHLATAANGNFVISYTQVTGAGEQDVLARMYGLTSGRAHETRFIRVADAPGVTEADSDIARLAGLTAVNQTNFVIAYTVNGGDVLARRYDINGNLLNPNTPALRIADRFFTEKNPSIAVNNATGKFVIAWQQQLTPFGDFNISARTIAPNAVLGPIRDVRTFSTDDTEPEVAWRDGTHYAISYRSQTIGSFVFQINVTSVTDSGAPTFSAVTQTIVNQSFTGPITGLSTLSIDPADPGHYLLAYTMPSGTGIAGNLFVQRRQFA